MRSLEGKLLAACPAIAGRCSEQRHHRVWCSVRKTTEPLNESARPPQAAPLSSQGYSASQSGTRSRDRKRFGLQVTFSFAVPTPEALTENSPRECVLQRSTPSI